MTSLRAEPLSPIDAATLWPQLRRLSTEVLATRTGESLLLRSGLAATGLANLPRMPRTLVVGVKRGLSYRGVLVARELAGGASWEALSLRLARAHDDDAVLSLLAGAGWEVASRDGRALVVRYPQGSPYEAAIRRGGLVPYRVERAYAVHGAAGPAPTGWFRPLRGAPDRQGVFRLYCRAVPEHIRRMEATTLHEWRATLDSYDCEREFIAESDRGVIAWVGTGERETRVMIEAGIEGLVDAALDFAEAQCPRNGAIVLAEDQVELERVAAQRGYLSLAVRLLGARRLAVMNPLKEVAAVPAESLAIPR